MVRAVLFDVDGVLVHPWRFRETLARDHGITPDMTAAFFQGPFIRCVQGQADVLEVLPAFLASWGWPGSATEFVARWLSVENAPDDAVLGVVTDIRRSGIPCFVASTQERRRAQYLATEMRFGQLFDGLFFSCDLGVEKPKEAVTAYEKYLELAPTGSYAAAIRSILQQLKREAAGEQIIP